MDFIDWSSITQYSRVIHLTVQQNSAGIGHRQEEEEEEFLSLQINRPFSALVAFVCPPNYYIEGCGGGGRIRLMGEDGNLARGATAGEEVTTGN